jgi:hypothetical protein
MFSAKWQATDTMQMFTCMNTNEMKTKTARWKSNFEKSK